jgi:hypothetical protein
MSDTPTPWFKGPPVPTLGDRCLPDSVSIRDAHGRCVVFEINEEPADKIIRAVNLAPTPLTPPSAQE